MAYGLRYYSEFTGVKGTKTKIEIRQESKADDTGAEFLSLPQNPVVFSTPKKDRYDPIQSKGVKIRVRNTIAQGFLYFADLFGGGETDHKIIIYKTNVEAGDLSTYKKVFEGFILPEVYEDNFSALPHNILISATDRLNALDQITPIINGDDAQILGTIIDGLNATGIYLNLTVGARLFAEGHNVSIIRTLYDQTYLDDSVFIEDNGELRNYKDIIENLLKPFTCRISQGFINGSLHWIIDRVPELGDTSRHFVTYNTSGSYLTNFDHTPKKLKLLTDVDLTNNAPAIQYQSGFKSVEVEQKLIKYPNLLSNTDQLANAVEVAAGNRLAPVRGAWVKHDDVNVHGAWHYNNLGFGYTDLGSIVTDGNGAPMGGDTYINNNPITTTKELDGIATRFRFSYSNSDEALDLSVVATMLDRYYGDDFSFFGLFELEIMGVGYIIQDWDTSETPNKLDGSFSVAQTADLKRLIAKVTLDEQTLRNYDREAKTKDFKISIPLSEVLNTNYGDYEAFFRLAPFRKKDDFDNNDLDDSYLHWLTVPIIDIKANVTNSPEQDNVTTGVINTNFTRLKKVSFMFGDVENLNYKNGFVNGIGNRLTGWQEDGETPFTPIVERFILDVFQTYHKARFTMTLEVKTTDNINLYDLIDDDTLTNKLYYISGLVYNAKAEAYKLTLNEYIKDDGVTE